jgi:DNA polymerase
VQAAENRRQKQNEIKVCSSFVDKEIALIDPKVLVPFGYYATRYVLKRYNIAIPESRAEFSGLYGKLFEAQHKRVYPLPHPASLLYNKSYKPLAREKYGKLRVLLETSKRSARSLYARVL